MDAMWTIVLRIFLVTTLLGHAIGAAYFASVVNQQIHPYFDSHGMEADASTSQLVFIYLFLSAGFASGSAVTTTVSFWLPSQSTTENKPISCCHALWRSIQACFGLFMITMGIITAKTSWSWGRLFEADDESHLAKQSFGLAAMMVAIFLLVTCFILSALVLYIATHLATRVDDTQSSTNDSFAKDVESQTVNSDASRKKEKKQAK